MSDRQTSDQPEKDGDQREKWKAAITHYKVLERFSNLPIWNLN